MPGATVRISDKGRRVLRELSARTGRSMQALLDEAIEQLRRRRFLEEANRAFQALRDSPRKWKQEEDERAEWEEAVADGLEED